MQLNKYELKKMFRFNSFFLCEYDQDLRLGYLNIFLR